MLPTKFNQFQPIPTYTFTNTPKIFGLISRTFNFPKLNRLHERNTHSVHASFVPKVDGSRFLDCLRLYPLVFKCGSLIVEIPRCCRNVLRYVRIDVSTLFVYCSGGSTSLNRCCTFELSLSC